MVVLKAKKSDGTYEDLITDDEGRLQVFDPAIAPAVGITSTDGNIGGTVVVDTARTEPNDHWSGMGLLITSGDYKGQVKEIISWTLASGEFLVDAFGGQILEDVTYKIVAILPATISIEDILSLVTILSNRLTPARAGYLDHLIAPDTAGTHDVTTVNDSVETDMLEIAKTTVYGVSIYINVRALIDAAEGGTVTFKMYSKCVDEANYEEVGKAVFVVGTNTTHPSFEANMINHNVKVTVQCSTDVTVTRELKYRYIVRDLE